MLWRRATYGERAFLHIYEALGRHVSVGAYFGGTLDFLANQQSFQEFAKLHATIETFIRCMRAAVYLQPQITHLTPAEYGRQLVPRF